MNYPKNVTLRKIKTLEDANHPQQDKYPDNTEREGLLYEETLPKVGFVFQLMLLKYVPKFRTSKVTEILGRTNKQIIFKTQNSLYEITIR